MQVTRPRCALKASSCAATYGIFLVIGMIPVLLASFAALRTGSGWDRAVIFTAFPCCLVLWVSRFQLEVSDDVLFYRTLFAGTRSISLSAVAVAELTFGMNEAFGPVYRLVLYPSPGSDVAPVTINVKVFSRTDIDRLLDILGPKLKGRRRHPASPHKQPR